MVPIKNRLAKFAVGTSGETSRRTLCHFYREHSRCRGLTEPKRRLSALQTQGRCQAGMGEHVFFAAHQLLSASELVLMMPAEISSKIPGMNTIATSIVKDDESQ